MRPEKWSASHEGWLVQARQNATIAELREQVEQGAALFGVYQGETQIGAFILRIDHSAEGDEGVIVAGAGQLHGFDFLDGLLPHMEKLFHGVRSIRVHTARPSMARKLAALGYTAAEMVFRKAVAA